MTLTRTTCPYCGVGCGVLAAADGTIKGDPTHPANYGRLCSKGSALGETIDLDGRLLAPQIGGRSASWERALDLVSERFASAIAEHGPESVAFYVSGQLLTEDYYVANKLMKGYIGSANIDTNSRLCMASSVAGHKRAFGTDTVPGTYEDLEAADLVVLVGSNLAWCHPVLYQRIAAAKTARPDMRVVTIDPRRTATTALADLHLQIAPDGDIALFNGLLLHLAETGAVDDAYVAAHVAGFAETLAAARASDPAEAGIEARDRRTFFDLWAGTQRVVTVYSQGVNQSRCGTDKVNAILNCHLATGRIGKPGAGPFSVTGQPNAMGGREVGGLANMLANHLDIDAPAHRAAVQDFWQSPTICTRAGLKAVDLFEACGAGRIKALWIMSTNPAASMPDADGVVEALRRVPFVVVSDIMADTDTVRLADVRLPATGWGEKAGTVTNSERRISRQRAFLPPPGAARPDWQILCDVARRMGWGTGFDYAGPEEIFAEYVALSQATRGFGRDLDLRGFAAVDYDTLVPQQWPADGRRFFAEGGFFHPDGKARMIPVAQPARPQPGFLLNTGRNRDQWHTMTRTGKAPRLGAHLAEPYLELHPGDAASLGLGPGDLVCVENEMGRAVLRALPTDRVRKGEVFAPMHWTRTRSSSGWVNAVVPPVTDPLSGQPALKSGQVHVRRHAAGWFGFVAADCALAPRHAYSAVARSRTGWQAELAGDDMPSDWQAELARMTGIARGDAAILSDNATGSIRLALTENGVVRALFFAAPGPVALSRNAAIATIGAPVSALEALAGRAPLDRPDPGPTICACLAVGRATLLDAIAAGASSVPELGASTGAGTSCGSCRPELAALLDTARDATQAAPVPPMAAE